MKKFLCNKSFGIVTVSETAVDKESTIVRNKISQSILVKQWLFQTDCKTFSAKNPVNCSFSMRSPLERLFDLVHVLQLHVEDHEIQIGDSCKDQLFAEAQVYALAVHFLTFFLSRVSLSKTDGYGLWTSLKCSNEIFFDILRLERRHHRRDYSSN